MLFMIFFYATSIYPLPLVRIAEATKAGRYSLENGNTGSQPYTPAPLQADCHEIHETAATLLATLGQPIFEPLTNTPVIPPPQRVTAMARQSCSIAKALAPMAWASTPPRGLWCSRAPKAALKT